MKTYKLKHAFGLKENKVRITLEDLEQMNKEVRLDRSGEVCGFIFGLEAENE